MTYIKPSLIPKGKGASESKNLEIVMLDLNDVATEPSRDTKGVVMVGNYAMKASKYVTKMQTTSSKTSLPVTSEGEEDNISISALPEFYFPGSPLEIEEFIQNWTGKSLVVGVQVGACGGGSPFYRMYGSKCAPLSLIVEKQNNNDGTGYVVKFQQFTKSDNMPGRYAGTFTLDTATVVAADATVVDVTSGTGEFQLQDNAAATIITDLTNATNNGIYTLIGSGGTNPATIESANTDFVLAGGVDWQGLAGATITFNAIDAGGGDHVFIEASRA